MKLERIVLASGAVGAAVLGFVLLWFFLPSQTNELGLTGADMISGGRPDLGTLRANTRAVAEAFLNEHKADLLPGHGTNYSLVLDYPKQSQIQSLGYRSSFYYYCFDIYLPYSVQSTGLVTTVLVQVSDKTAGHHHDPQKFHVIRSVSLDAQGKVIKEIGSDGRGN